MGKMILIKTSFPNEKEAQSVAQQIVEDKLAACIQINVGHSIYSWENKIENNQEFFLEIKTKEENIYLIENFLSKVHPYKTFEFIVLELDYINKSYESWLKDIIK